MRTAFAARLTALASTCLIGMAAAKANVDAGDDAEFSGRYGHAMTASSDEVVWTIDAEGGGWRVSMAGDTPAETTVASAHPLGAAGRAAFWRKMLWPEAGSRQARCLSWGEAPAGLSDLLDALEGKPPAIETAPADRIGASVLCRVPADARRDIGWIAGNASDWFYYDSVFGVMEIQRLP